MNADIAVSAPFGIIPGTEQNIGVVFEGMPRSDVVVTLTSGDPIGAISLDLIREYVHKLYEDGDIPHSETRTGQSFLGFTFDAYMELYDDESDSDHDIEVSQPDATHLNIKIPFYLRLSSFTGPLTVLSPMGIEGDIMLNAAYSQSAGRITCDINTATVSIENVQPASGIEGSNFSTNNAAAGIIGINLEEQLKNQVRLQILTVLSSLARIEVDVPTVAQIETLIGDEVHQELLSRRYFGAWTPETPEGSDVTIDEARPKALSDALAIAINPGTGADENALANFIPAEQSFAVGLDDEFVEQTIQSIVDSPRNEENPTEGGFGGIPCELGNIEGHNVDINDLHWECQTGRIHFWGEVTVHDVFCGADADVEFWADIGLRWTPPNADGAQTLEPYIIDSDADLPWWAWLLAALTFLFGIILGIIAIVITAITEKIVERVGGAVMEDEVSGKLQSLGAWPQQLQGIGTVISTFQETVVIEPSGLIFSGTIFITSTYGLTMVSAANGGGPYFCKASEPIHLQAGFPHAHLIYEWDLGDGTTATGAAIDHIYIDDGLYRVRVKVRVTEPGGATTNHSVFVKAENVPPTVNAGTDKEVFEGEVVNFIGRFTDQEYPDTHEAVWIFGDDTLPEAGLVTETNSPPVSQGSVTGSHTYCNNGDYEVILRVTDKDGGVGEDKLMVKVKNLPPEVTTDDIFYAYPCTPVTLIAEFTDAGWCDTHTGRWTFGDCTPPLPATVKEVNLPPKGYGIVAATHTYMYCGKFLAEVTVTDSDGESGTSSLPVQVVDVKNKDFEGGFRILKEGTVANFWEPYAASTGTTLPTLAAAQPGADNANYRPAGFVVHGGQRSQCIYSNQPFKGGIYQKVPTNKGWDFQIAAWYHLDERYGGVARLGIDSSGGTDHNSSGIVWMTGTEQHVWDQLADRVTAQSNELTIFLEVQSVKGAGHGYFEDVHLQAWPCPLKEPVPPEEPENPEPQSACLDWKNEQKAHSVGTVYEKENFIFQSLSDQEMRIALWGAPNNTGKLTIPRQGMKVFLPFKADLVRALVATYAGTEIKIETFDKDGNLLNNVASTLRNEPEWLEVQAEGIHYLIISGGGGEGLLIRLCISSGIDLEEDFNSGTFLRPDSRLTTKKQLKK